MAGAPKSQEMAAPIQDGYSGGDQKDLAADLSAPHLTSAVDCGVIKTGSNIAEMLGNVSEHPAPIPSGSPGFMTKVRATPSPVSTLDIPPSPLQAVKRGGEELSQQLQAVRLKLMQRDGDLLGQDAVVGGYTG